MNMTGTTPMQGGSGLEPATPTPQALPSGVVEFPDAIAHAAGASMGRPLRLLLVVDKDREAARMLLALRQAGFAVRHERVSDSLALRGALARSRWDVVIADLHLPRWSGLEALREVQTVRAELPVILVGGDSGSEAAIEALRQGASDCIHRSELPSRLAFSVQQSQDRLAEQKLVQQQRNRPQHVAQRAQQALAVLPVAVYECDTDGYIRQFNRAAADLWGCEPDIARTRWNGAYHQFTADGLPLAADRCPMATCLRTGMPVHGTETIIERPDGSQRHVEQHAHPLRDADGTLTGAINILLDRTERQRQERRLLLSDAASRSMFDNNPAACMMNLPQAGITSVNNRFVEMTGYSRAELLGRKVEELALWIGDPQSLATLARIRDTGQAEGLPAQFRRKDGDLRRVIVSTTKVNVGGVEQMLTSFVDLTSQQLAFEEARLARTAMAAVSQGVLVADAERRILSINQTFAKMTGYTQDELLGQSCAILQGPDTSVETVQAMRTALRQGQSFQAEILNYRKNGQKFWNQLLIDPVHDDMGRLTHFVGIQRDITEERARQAELQLSQQVFAQSREGVVVTDARRRIVMVNNAFTSITGYTQQEVLGHNPSMLSAQRHDAVFYRDMWRSVISDGAWQGEVWNRHKNGTEYLERLAVHVLRDADGNVSNFIGTFSDITEQRAAQERIDWLSHFDPLTQLPNRELLADRCTHDISLAQRDGKPLTMMVLDMDRFKLINETLGYALGNRVIKKFARRLVQTVRSQDTVARLGADEFALVLPGETPDGAAHLVERLQAILSEPFGVADQEASTSVSIGIAVHPADGTDFEGLLKSALVAMHEAKARGGNQHRFYNAEMFAASTQRMTIGSALRSAIHDDQLQVHYQPFVDMQSGRIVGMEALLRWTHPELGPISPATFIPLAEQSGQIVAIGAWVLRQACSDMQQWRARGLPTVPVSVNLSPLQFRDPALLDTVRQTIDAFAVEPGDICLELTEGAVMDDVTHSEKMMRALKDLGVTLSLDDFGTGYSSLSYLKRFPFDKVKIDQSFVRDINRNNQDAVIAKVVISMAHGLGLRVIAEGVENELQCEFLRSNVCDEIQGYFFSRPIPAASMEALLREDRRLPAHLVRVQTKLRTVLLVDDEPNVLASLKRLLRPDGYRILSASSGQEGLDMLARQPVDIIVSDQRMPGMTGVQFLRQAKALYPQTIRIVLSGHTELQSVTDAINEGAVYRFLTKPWDDAQLRDFIEQAFRHKELADENETLNIKVMTANQELATSNRQLQEVLDRKQRALVRGEQNLDVLRDALMQVDLPVLAIDDDGVVAFANTQAEQLGPGLQLLGNELAARLPSLAALVNSAAPQRGRFLSPRGLAYLARWQAMGHASNARGLVITLIPTHEGGSP
ncbi:MAG: EAL domain-containing protein [Rhodoferax sp.]|jgi:diguanylate cyclase (GGDEF)-like protein/PAS domain S-box-containing protein|nr:EAL domain-containing protein [Rhodoferax sp.]